MSVLAKWHAAVVVGLLHEELEPAEWKELHVGAKGGINCEHVQALLTNIFAAALGSGRKIVGMHGCQGSSGMRLRLWQAWT